MNNCNVLARASGSLVVLLALASCATVNREGSVAPLDGGTVAVRQGAPLVVNLSADASTGFGWVIVSQPGDAVWLIGGPDYTPDPIPAGMMGVGGTTTYRFRALQPGTQTLEFAYLPSADKVVAPTRTVRYDVTVKSAGWQNWF
jgi:inhibitor of cysteine peptidase